MINRYKVFARVTAVVMAVAFVAPLAANAATVTGGSLTLGDSRPGQTTSYTFAASGFTTGTQIRCIQLKLNTAADGTGSVPSNLTHTGATVSTNTIASGLTTVDNGTAGSLRATSSTLTNPAASGNVVFSSVVNGNTADTTYYAILSTHVLQDCTGAAVDSTVVAFMYKNGALVTMSVDPTLTFTVAGVASGTVNGASITVASDPTSIAFGNDVTTSSNGVSAHDVTVATNGGGFSLYLKQSGNFASGANVIDPWSGSNASPTAFPAAGTDEAWGYTTQDATLEGSSARFTTANGWAGMPTTNAIVADSATMGSQLTRIGHQLAIDSTTPAGNYSTTLVYTAAGTY